MPAPVRGTAARAATTPPCAAIPAITAASSSAGDQAQRRSTSADCPSAAAPRGGGSTGTSPGRCWRACGAQPALLGPDPSRVPVVPAQVNYLSGSVSLGILVAFVALFVLLFGALKLMRSLDEGWILVRRAAGHDQRGGALGASSRSPPPSARGVRDLVRVDPRARQHGHVWPQRL